MFASVVKSGCSKYRLHSGNEIAENGRKNFAAAKNGHVGVQWLFWVEKGTMISAEYFAKKLVADVYYAGFSNVERISAESDLFVPDRYPDLLIPMQREAVCEYSGWFTVYYDFFVPAETPAGEYSVTLGAEVNGRKQEEKISIRVYNCTVSPLNHVRSCFLLCDKDIAFGEGYFDRELKRIYYERLLDFRLNSFVLPVNSRYTAEEVAEEADRYFDHPMFTAYALQNDTGGKTSARTDTYYEQIVALAKRSRPGRNLLEKAYTYFYDEADEGGRTAEALDRVRSYKKSLAAVVSVMEKDDSEALIPFKSIPGWRNSILNLPCVGTIHFTSKCAELIDETGIWCPAFIRYEDKSIREKFRRIAENTGKELWWYGCMGPRYPHPTYHIDDYLLSSRILGWMQCAYGIKGLLYWNAAGYLSDDTYRDIYTNPYKGKNLPAGDGFLFYPGKKYGIAGPLPSLRLMSIRNGLEDFELLLAAKEKAKQSGLSENFLYGDLFENVLYDVNENSFLKYHRRLLAWLEGSGAAVCESVDPMNFTGDLLSQIGVRGHCFELCLSHNGATDGRAIEICLRPEENRWTQILLPLAAMARPANRLRFTIRNFESRSLTLFVYVCCGEEKFLCQAREVFENTCITVDIPISLCIQNSSSEQDVLRLDLRNTYPQHEKYPMRIAIGDWRAE